MDSSFLHLKNVAIDISTNPSLSRYAINTSITSQREAIKILNSYNFQNELISNISLYYRDMPLMYTNSGTQFPDTFAKSMLQIDSENRSLEELLINTTIPTLYCSSYNKDKFQILYVIPIPVDSLYPKGWTLYILSESTIKKPIIQMMKKYNSVTLVMNADNNIITQIGGAIDSSSLNIDELLSDKSTNENIIEINGTRYLYQYAYSNLEFLSYLTLIPYDIATAKLNSFRYYFVLGISTFFILGFLLIIVLGKNHYKPIKNLKDFTTSLLGGITEQKNDFEIIHNSIKTLHDRDIAMRSILTYSNRALRSYILKKLLLGEFTNTSQLNKNAASIGIYFNSNVFRVVTFSLKQQFQSTQVTTEEAIGFVEKHFDPDYNIYGTDTLASNNLIFIVSNDPSDLQALKLCIADVKSKLEKQFDVSVSVGIGRAYTDTVSLPKSYLESLIAIDFCFAKTLYSMSCYEEINLFSCCCEKQSINKELYDMQTFLRQGDAGTVLHILNEIQLKLVNKDNSILIVRHFCYSIYYTIMQAVNEQDNILHIIAKDYMEALMFCNTAESFFKLLAKLCIEICSEFSAQHESQNSELCNRALKYIDEYYTNPDFSVNTMAETLKVSPSYLSRYFKDQTGKTITEYLINKRMEKAKEMLRSTDEPIRSIIQHVGYQNETSFVRTFKKIEGITPGIYRNKLSV